MVSRFGIVLVTIFFLVQGVSAAQLVNLGGEFDAFVKAAEGQDKAGVEAEWVKVEAQYQSIYDDAVYRKAEPGWERRVQQRRDSFFAEYKQLAPQMGVLFTKAEDIVRVQEDRFRSLFPDLSPTIPVVFLPSLFAFNGQVRHLQGYGQPGLLMGVDFIVKRNDNQNVLFSHEFFHAYHESHLPKAASGQTMATPLWKEGFATYVSGVLNPNESDTVLLMDTALAQACSDPKAVAQMAAEYLKVIKTDGRDSYRDWFMMSGPTQPTRRGYCLGLKIIRILAEKYPVSEMVNWDEARFSEDSWVVLNSMLSQ